MHRHLARIAWNLQQAQSALATSAHTGVPCISSANFVLYHALSSLLGSHQLPGWCSGLLEPLQQPDQSTASIYPLAGLSKPTCVLEWRHAQGFYSSSSQEHTHKAAEPRHSERTDSSEPPSDQQQSPSLRETDASSKTHTGRASDESDNSTDRPAPDTVSDHEASKTDSSSSADRARHSHNTSSSGSSSSGSHQQHSESDKDDEDVTDLLVEWRLRTSEWYGGGLNHVINSHLQMPQMSSWSSLYPGTSSLGFLARLLFPKGSSLLTRILKWQFRGSRQIVIPLLKVAHEELNSSACIEDFKEHLGMAIGTVLELYAQADWQALKPMVSSGLLESMQAAHDAQLETADALGTAGSKVEDVRVDIHQLDVVCAHAISRAQLAAIDQDRSKARLLDSTSTSGNSGSTSNSETNAMWDVVHVYVECQCQATMRTPDGVERISQPKSGHWVFCRGPVHFDKVVSAEADLPWFVLAWL